MVTGAPELTEEATAAAMGALFELFLTPEGNQDAHRRFRVLHEHAPVYVGTDGGMVLSGYEHCQAVLRNNALGKDLSPSGMMPGGGTADDEVTQLRREILRAGVGRPQTILMMNPPDHTRVRGLVSRAFTPRRVNGMAAHIEELAEECFDNMAEAGEFDLLELLGFPFPVSVIGELVGVPRSDWPDFRARVTASAATLETTASADDLRQAMEAQQDSWEYFIGLVEQKRSHPGDDLLTDMLAVSDEDGDRLSEGEAIAQALLMFAAGFETTTNLIGNGMAALLTHPEQFAALREDPTLVDSAVEEMLRWDSPVQLDARSALEDTELDGMGISAGTRVITLLGAANRDPSRFSDPDVFDISRAEGPPLSFAAGIHYCLGANLARAEGRAVFSGLLRRFSSIELNGELKRRHRLTLAGWEAVPVKVKAT